MSSAFLPPPTHRLFLPLRPNPNPLLTPKRPSIPTPSPVTSSLKPDFLIAAASALTLALTHLPPAPSSAVPTPPPLHHPPPALVFSHLVPPPHSSLATTLAVVGVAHAPIHHYPQTTIPHQQHQPYQQQQQQQQPQPQPPSHHPSLQQREAADDAHHELVLASRLITAVLLGVMVGIERRATALNLGVRSITLITLTTAVCSVVATSFAASATGIAAYIAVAPAVFVAVAGLASALGLFVVAASRKPTPLHINAMCVLVGIVATMGGACGAGLSLVSAACYLAAVALMRANRRNVDTPPDVEHRELRVHSHTAWDGDNVMALRITQPDQRHTTRVVEMGSTVIRHSPPDTSFADDTL